MAEKILFLNAKSCTVVDQYVELHMGLFRFVWVCYGAKRT